MAAKWKIALARARLAVVIGGATFLFAGGRFGVHVLVRLAIVAAGPPILNIAGTVHREPLVVRPPVSGRWRAHNSPASMVPSHGVHLYGQTYAIDMAYEPSDVDRSTLPWRPLTRRPDAFPGFGEQVLASADGLVVRICDGVRDHRSRDSYPAMAYLVVEGLVRILGGPSRLLGNHVILDLGDGVYAAYAHLLRGSVRVARGQRVVAGEHLADCGNSGNSSEPHLHIQLMDHPNVLVAAGLPMAFDHFLVDGEMRSGLPANGEHFEHRRPSR